MNNPQISKKIDSIAINAKLATSSIANADISKRNTALKIIAESINLNSKSIIKENKKDIDLAKKMNLPKSFIERLTITKKTIDGIAESINQIIKLDDPLNIILEKRKLNNGIFLRKISVPIGVIGIIYESRPNVTIDCAALCIKSGNVCILKGGKEAINSNKFLAKIIKNSCKQAGLDENVVQFINITDRSAIKLLLTKYEFIDLIIPRGGEGLIKFVVENSKIPVIKQYKGICHIYVDEYGDLDKAVKISFNAKVQRPSVCNAAECILINEKIAKQFLEKIKRDFDKAGVQIRGCKKTAKFIDCIPAKKQDWDTEFLDLIVAVKIVNNIDEAIEFINKHGTGHSEAIITENKFKKEKFFRQIDAACLYSNASTRFTDGFEFGLGAEIGISTDKIHARGPMGLAELTAYKYLLEGDGQIK